MASISSVHAISRFRQERTVCDRVSTSASCMCRRSSRRWTVIPSAPASSHQRGRRHGIGLGTAARLSQGRDVVDVYVEPLVARGAWWGLVTRITFARHVQSDSWSG